MKTGRSVIVAAVIAFGLVAGNSLAVAAENSQNSSSSQPNIGSMGTQKGKMGETERAVPPQTDQTTKSGKMSEPNDTGK